MSVQHLADVRFPEPSIDAAADLDAHDLGNVRRAPDTFREVDLAKSSFAEAPIDSIPKA
jgi:hypothetical protein